MPELSKVGSSTSGQRPKQDSSVIESAKKFYTFIFSFFELTDLWWGERCGASPLHRSGTLCRSLYRTLYRSAIIADMMFTVQLIVHLALTAKFPSSYGEAQLSHLHSWCSPSQSMTVWSIVVGCFHSMLVDFKLAHFIRQSLGFAKLWSTVKSWPIDLCFFLYRHWNKNFTGL